MWRRSDSTRQAAKACNLVVQALGTKPTETSKARLRAELRPRPWISSPLFVERRENVLRATLHAPDRENPGVAPNRKPVEPQSASRGTRKLLSEFQPLSVPQRSIELKISKFAHTQEAVGTDWQSGPKIPVVLTVRTTGRYASQVTREGQDRRNAQFVPFVLEQELRAAPVRMAESVSLLRSLGISGRGFEPTLAVATYEQYPAEGDSDKLQHITGRSLSSSGSTNSAIDWMRQGFASPYFLSFDIEQPMPEEQNTAPIGSQPMANFRNRPVREVGNHLHLSAAAGTWSEPFELLPPGPLTLESSLMSGATNCTLPLSLLEPLDGVVEFRHLTVAAATSTWCEPTPWEVAKTRAHEPLLSLRGPSCKSLIPSTASQPRSDSLFPLAPFVYEYRGGSRPDQGQEAAAHTLTSDPASTWDLEALNTVLSSAGADSDPAASEEDFEVDTETRLSARSFRRCLAGTVRPNVLYSAA